MEINDILKMTDDELCKLMLKHPFDRLGHDGDVFCMALTPTGDYTMNMFVPVERRVVEEFYIRLLCGDKYDWTYDR